MWLDWTGPPGPAHFTRTGCDTCPALLAPLALLTLKVLLSTTGKVKCFEEGKVKRGWSSYKVPGWSS